MRPFDFYRSAVFDCDGVILDSNSLKTEAFRSTLVGEPPQKIDQFIEYHKSHGGISRYVKFDYYYRVMKRTPDHPRETSQALERYAEICRKGLLECALIPGIIEILNSFKSLGVVCYVLSGGDQDEVRTALAARGLSQYFLEIFGSPRSKREHLGDMVAAGLERPGVYFGDAESDYRAAKEFSLDFIFVAGRSEWSGGIVACQAAGHYVCHDYGQLICRASA